MAIVDAHNDVTDPVNRESFPANPRDSKSDDSDVHKNGGWGQIQKLAAKAKQGEKVDAAQFIIGAGNWMGTFNSGSF
jgi:hypothetical protein